MFKSLKIISFLALTGLFVISIPNFYASAAELPLDTVADKMANQKIVAAGFYQFNNLEIFKSPAVNEPPTTLEVIQKNEKSCVVYENGKTNLPLPCLFSNNENSTFFIQIDERTTQDFSF